MYAEAGFKDDDGASDSDEPAHGGDGEGVRGSAGRQRGSKP